MRQVIEQKREMRVHRRTVSIPGCHIGKETRRQFLVTLKNSCPRVGLVNVSHIAEHHIPEIRVMQIGRRVSLYLVAQFL